MPSPFLISTILGIVYGIITVIVVIYSYRIIVICRRYLYGKKTEIATENVRFKKETHYHTSTVIIGAGTTVEREVPGPTTTSYSHHIYYSFCDYQTKEYIVKILRKYCDRVLPVNVEAVCLQYIGTPFYFGPFEIKENITESIYQKYMRGNYPSNLNIRYDSKYPPNCNIVENESIFSYIIYGFGYMLLLAAFVWFCILLDSPLTASENDIVATCMIFILMVFITSMTIICCCIKSKDPCCHCFNGWFDRYYLNKNLLFQLQCDDYDERDRCIQRERVQSLQPVGNRNYYDDGSEETKQTQPTTLRPPINIANNHNLRLSCYV